MRSRKKTKMNISVVVPVKKTTRTFKRCLESILDQTFSGHEVVIVDGSRSEKVEKIVHRYKKRSFNINYVREDFFSMGSLKNRGIMVSKGDIIMMTEADCEVPREWIQGMTEPIKKGADLVQGDVSLSSRRFWSRIYQRSEDRLWEKLSIGNSIDHIDCRNAAFRKDVLLSIGMYDRQVRGLEDLHLKIRLKRYGFRIHHMNSVKVVQHRKVRLNDLFWESVERGRWLFFISRIERRGGQWDVDEMLRTLSLRGHLMFLPSLAVVLFTGGPLGFIAELVTGTGLRMGFMAGSYRVKRFIRSIQTRYY